QAAGETADARSDLFSLGVVLFRILTGRLPFEGETPLEILTAVGSETAPTVSKFNPEVPESVVVLVQRLLSRNPNDRLQTAEELAKVIAEIVKQLIAPSAHSAPPPKPTRHIKWIAVALILPMVAFGIGCYFWFEQSKSQDTALIIQSRPARDVLTPNEAMEVIGDQVSVEFVVG